MELELYNKSGDKAGQVELNDEIFAIEPNEHAMHLAVVAYLANNRQGTRKTKIRSEVRGGGKKPWRQKGRGTARAGSTRSPIWTGGGTIHGPKPQKFTKKLSKKLKRLARKSALSVRFSENNIKIVEDFTLEEVKTKEIYTILKNLNLEQEKTLVMINDYNKELYLSARNIPNVSIAPADKISTYDILSHKKLLIFKDAISKIEENFGN